MNELPDFFWADRLTPVNFYGYESATQDVIYEVMAYNEDEKVNVDRFNDLKRKCMAMHVNMQADATELPNWSKDVWDNRIVIECKTETGGTIFVGFFDSIYSIGLSMCSAAGRTARPYKVVLDPEKELIT